MCCNETNVNIVIKEKKKKGKKNLTKGFMDLERIQLCLKMASHKLQN